MINNNRFTRQYIPTNVGIGVNEELHRLATNNPSNPVGVGVNGDIETLVPEDEMFLSNEIHEDKDNDNIDKQRYYKEVKAYVNVHSGARLASPSSLQSNVPSFVSTGTTYTDSYDFSPYSLLTLNGQVIIIDGKKYIKIYASDNHIQFTLHNAKTPQIIEQVYTKSGGTTFDCYLPVVGQTLSVADLREIIETNLNLSVKQQSSITEDIFTVIINTTSLQEDLANYTIFTYNTTYTYTMIFLTDSDTIIESTSIAADQTSYLRQVPENGTNADFQYYIPNVFPNPNHYALDLNKTYTLVKSIRVVSSDIPNTDTIINGSNNHITFQLIKNTENPIHIMRKDGSINWDVYIPYGNYTLDQLIDEMLLLINTMIYDEAGIKDMFEINANQITNVFEISVNNPYAFMWNFNGDPKYYWRNLYQMLGFKSSKIDYFTTLFTNIDNTTTHSPYRPIILKTSLVVWLQLNNYQTTYDTFTGQNYFAQFSLTGIPYGQFAHDTFLDTVQTFDDSPLPKLSTVDVRLFDEFGNPYNFSNVNHLFTLEITYYIDRLSGTDYSSRRGTSDHSYIPTVHII